MPLINDAISKASLINDLVIGESSSGRGGGLIINEIRSGLAALYQCVKVGDGHYSASYWHTDRRER